MSPNVINIIKFLLSLKYDFNKKKKKNIFTAFLRKNRRHVITPQTLNNIVISTFDIKLLYPIIISSYQVQSPLVNMEVWYVGPKHVCHTPISIWYYSVNKRMDFWLPSKMSKNFNLIISLSQVVNGIMNTRTIKSFTT